MRHRISWALRRALAEKYSCPPGETVQAPCYWCGCQAAVRWQRLSNNTPSGWVTFEHEIDHLIERARGGLTTIENLVLACRPCNRGRFNRPRAPYALEARS